METVFPENLSELDATQLADLKAKLVEEFDKKYEEGGDLAVLSEIADAIDKTTAAEQVLADAEAKESADRQALLDRVKGQPEDTTDDDPKPEPEAADDEQPAAEDDTKEPVSEDPDPAPSEEKELVTAAAKPSASAIRNRAPKPEAPAVPRGNVVITAAQDVPGVATGAQIDLDALAAAFHARARGLADHSPRVSVATVGDYIPQEHMITDGRSATEVMDAVVAAGLAGGDAEALIASGGWCTPSENLFDQFSIESRDGLLDLPTVGVTRGGTNTPSFFGISDAAGALWSWDEDIDAGVALTITDIDVASGTATATTSVAHNLLVGSTVKITNASDATLNGNVVVLTTPSTTTSTYATAHADRTNFTADGTIIKACLTIPCPTWTDTRLEAEGLCVTHGNLMDRAYPEMTRRFVDLVMTAHLHRVSNAKLAKIVAGATAVTVTGASDAFGDVLNALDLQIADYRSQYLASENVVVEVACPMHLTNAIRSTLGMRAGIDPRGITLGQIVSEFTARNARPQFLSGYNPLWGGTAKTAWNATEKILMWFSGAYVAGDGGSIDLGVQRDSTLNETNDFTAAWSEQFYSVIQRGPAAREVTVATVVDGDTGGPKA